MKASLKKCYWQDVREEFVKLAPEFAEIVDALSPDKSFPLYEAIYPYGSNVVTDGVLHLPNDEGEVVALTDPSLNPEVADALRYNLGSNPCGFMVENCIEAFTTLDGRVIPFFDFLRPGTFFGTWQVLVPHYVSHYPEFLWNMTAGARSIFMLAKISEAGANNKLKRAFSLMSNKPRSMLEHWYMFREIAQHPNFPTPWQARMYFFANNWFEHLEDPAWHPFHRYLLKNAWVSSEFWRNQIVWSMVFSSVQKNRQIKASGHIISTVHHLITMAAGFSPGFIPAIDDSVAPVSGLQQVYVDYYQLKNYAPILMHPGSLSRDNNEGSVYYSLHYPTAPSFSPKSSGHSSTISDLYDVKMVMEKYLKEMRSGVHIDLTGTVIGDTAERAAFEYFHSDTELYHGMEQSSRIPEKDANFQKAIPEHTLSDDFPANSSFVRGCIRVARNGG